MKVAVTGATGVIGLSAVRALVAAGHDVVGLARTPEKADTLRFLGAVPAQADLFDHDGLVAMFTGSDAVCNFATRLPVGRHAALPRAWREDNRLRTKGVRSVVDAARDAGVRRLVQESVSYIYADNADSWINEQSPLDITRMTEPVAVGESHVQEYQCGSRHGVVLRFGSIVGDDPMTSWRLKALQRGHPIGTGSPDAWAHVLHTDDIGSAVVAALSAPSGVYNVGADPIRRRDLLQGFADAAGVIRGAFVSGLTKRLLGARIEPMSRSLRVCSEHFTASTGWTPRRASFEPSWFDVTELESRAFQ